MGKAIPVSALVLLLACSAQAGIMQNGSPAPPPPSSQPASAVQEPTTGSDIPTGETPDEATDILAQAALDLLALLQTLY